MDTLALLAHGFAIALTPYNLMWCALGVTIGTAIGVLPGIGPALTVALLLPITGNLVDPTSAFIMTTSRKPGSWWLKPLWSWRQTWLVSR